jgi:hypothetical protein
MGPVNPSREMNLRKDNRPSGQCRLRELFRLTGISGYDNRATCPLNASFPVAKLLFRRSFSLS